MQVPFWHSPWPEHPPGHTSLWNWSIMMSGSSGVPWLAGLASKLCIKALQVPSMATTTYEVEAWMSSVIWREKWNQHVLCVKIKQPSFIFKPLVHKIQTSVASVEMVVCVWECVQMSPLNFPRWFILPMQFGEQTLKRWIFLILINEILRAFERKKSC